MDLSFTAEENAFRQTLRDFFATKIPDEIKRKVREGRALSKDEIVANHRILNAHGYAVPHWPKEWGGAGWTPMQRYIFSEEILFNAVPSALQFNVFMVGPVIAAFGNEAQKRRFLPRIANCDDWWCQGFSEPGAGSDLASLRTTAARDGDVYIVNGQKTWTTYGQYADWIFNLVRTDPHAKKQQGISFLLIDMKTPGVSLKPIITIEGGHEVNEVFFDNVRVPVGNLVGEENKGWDCAKFLLGNERNNIARVGMSKLRLDEIRRHAKETPAGDGVVWDDPMFRRKVAELEIELKALEITQMRMIARDSKRAAGDNRPDPASSILKIRGSQIQQATTELLLEIAGPLAAAYHADKERPPGVNEFDDDWIAPIAPQYFNYRKVSIYGGSNEIQRNIIAKAFLGL
ncbi:acyl-CoA dehydrogenase family protein [Terrarubrum flagellatum]|uniref:acyl-CoA dehydrogenase family protein n=1 Tax=Terrirubrum flagellatum TaxID=2895980 RepID=UPI003144DA7A